MNWSTESIAGRRGNNEDSCGVFSQTDGTLLLVVADGMGGHQAGEVASAIAVETVRSCFEPDTDICIPEYLLRYIANKANLNVFRKSESDPAYAGMGATLVMGMVKGNTLYTANIGDSRLYIEHLGALKQVTKDHSYVQELVDIGVITEEETKTHPMRHIITRCIGTALTTEADVFTTALAAGDIVLLCSDGLSGALEPDQMLSILSDKNKTADQLAKELVSTAYDAGSDDNITVCVYIHNAEMSK